MVAMTDCGKSNVSSTYNEITESGDDDSPLCCYCSVMLCGFLSLGRLTKNQLNLSFHLVLVELAAKNLNN